MILTMCEATSASFQKRVVIDTYNSYAKGVDSCSCSAAISSSSASTTKLTIAPFRNHLQPGGKGCGSKIELSKGNKVSVSDCDLTNGFMDVKNGDVVYITWKIDLENSKSQYCANLQFSFDQNFSMSVTCTGVESTMQTQATVEALTSDVLQTTIVAQTTSVGDTTTILKPTVVIQATSETSTKQQETSQIPNSNASTANDDSFPVEIVAPAAGGAVLVLIIVVVVAVICSRKGKQNSGIPNQEEKQSRDSRNYDDSLQPYAAVNMVMNQDVNGDDGMKLNQLYVSADETIVVNGFSSNSSNMYAEVQKKSKSILKDDSRISKPVTTESTYSSPGPVYAVVNKNKYQGTGEENVPSRYLNEEGLVYTHVDVSGGEIPLHPPKQFSDTPPDDARVVYSEVTTEL